MKPRTVIPLIFALLLAIQTAQAQSSTSIDLLDLNVSQDRIPQWYPALEAEAGYEAAKSWPEYDVKCSSAPCPSGKLGWVVTGTARISDITASIS